jgi:small conductance mechanosensitive channel
MTELVSGDNVQVLIPNGQVWGAPLTNFSAYPMRRVSVTFVIPLDRDVDAIAADLRNYLSGDNRVAQSPAPTVAGSNLTDKGAELTVQAWTNADEAGTVRADLVAHVVGAVRVAGAAH